MTVSTWLGVRTFVSVATLAFMGYELGTKQPGLTAEMLSSASEFSGLVCRLKRQFGSCRLSPLKMVQECPGFCDEAFPHSELQERFLVPQAAPPEAVRKLRELAPNAVVLGDGYGGQAHPHSPTELFAGITPAAAARWAWRQPAAGGQRQRALEWAQTFVDLARLAKAETEKLFEIPKNSTFDYIHLTCRTRAAGDHIVEAMPPPPPHVDNCIVEGTTCVGKSPAFHWRSHSAILFLDGPESGDFAGGNLFFAPSEDLHVPVTPAPGLLAAFASGAANRHGNELVVRGARCELSLWLTSDKRAAHAHELEAAEEILKNTDDAASRRGLTDPNYFAMCAAASDAAGNTDASLDPVPKDVVELPLPSEGRVLRAEVLSDLPSMQLTRIPGFLTPAELKHFQRKADAQGFRDGTAFHNGKLQKVNYRTSRVSWLDEDKRDHTLNRVLDRIAAVTGLSLLSADQLQVAEYLSENEGRYEPHHDAKPSTRSRSGKASSERIATLLMYWNDVEEGGGTAFVRHNFTLMPKAGTALFWYNMLPSGDVDAMTLHGGCPVIKGSKYIITKWVHETGNEALYDAAEGGNAERFSRDWRRVAAQLAQGVEAPPLYREPLLRLRTSCEAQRARGDCETEALRMASGCPGACEEGLVTSALRGRHVAEGVVTRDIASDLLALAKTARDAGSVSHGPERAPGPGLHLRDAAKWAAAFPNDSSERKEAERLVRRYVSAVDAVQKSVVSLFKGASAASQASKDLRLDDVRLSCLSPRSEEVLHADAYETHDRCIGAGNDILVSRMTPAKAEAKCLKLPHCQGFTYRGPPTTSPVQIYFKSATWLYEEGYNWTSRILRERPSGDAHPAHADSCYQSDARCVRDGSRACRRSHAAVLFLHGAEGGDFAGGDFFYTPQWRSTSAERVLIQPSAGKMVAFVASESNINGVEEITSGERCSLTAYFTNDGEDNSGARPLEDEVESLLSS
eukprot:TRINITY_DN19315_c0_g2_i1.p1 TRINITY_DN19315_c0_g2~~TRINITY_DN19315_c0_g2_i1.p1  ORF type:complete len:968 (-),score=193.76 TRINITY_DN19315_c0_g2_i1:217-3120(-)